MPPKTQVWPKASVALNVVLALAVSAGLAYKFTDVRHVLENAGGGLLMRRTTGTARTSTRPALSARAGAPTW